MDLWMRPFGYQLNPNIAELRNSDLFMYTQTFILMIQLQSLSILTKPCFTYDSNVDTKYFESLLYSRENLNLGRT